MDKDTIHRGNQGDWNVKQVEEISPFFYVEKSHEVIKGKTASEIATDVCNFLKNNSIDAVYDDEEVRNVELQMHWFWLVINNKGQYFTIAYFLYDQ